MKKSSLVSVRQILAKASDIRQPKKVYCEMIGMYLYSLQIKGDSTKQKKDICMQ
jgi:hypothetical protein